MSGDHSPITCIDSTNTRAAAISHGTKTPTLTKLILNWRDGKYKVFKKNTIQYVRDIHTKDKNKSGQRDMKCQEIREAWHFRLDRRRRPLWEDDLGQGLKEVRSWLSAYQGEECSWPAEEQVWRPRRCRQGGRGWSGQSEWMRSEGERNDSREVTRREADRLQPQRSCLERLWLFLSESGSHWRLWSRSANDLT